MYRMKFWLIIYIKTYQNIQEVIDHVNKDQSPCPCISSARTHHQAAHKKKFLPGGLNIKYGCHSLLQLQPPFGGVNNSGIGSSHGFHSFQEFSMPSRFYFNGLNGLEYHWCFHLLKRPEDWLIYWLRLWVNLIHVKTFILMKFNAGRSDHIQHLLGCFWYDTVWSLSSPCVLNSLLPVRFQVMMVSQCIWFFLLRIIWTL